MKNVAKVQEEWIDKALVMQLAGWSEKKVERFSGEAGSGKPILKRMLLPEPGRRYKKPQYRLSDLKRVLEEEQAGNVIEMPAAPVAVRASKASPPLDAFAAILAALTMKVSPPAPPVPDAAFVSLKEASEHCKMPEYWLREAIESGRLPGEKLIHGRGFTYRVRLADVDAMPARVQADKK